MHLLAGEIMLQHLQKLGIFNSNVDLVELNKKRLWYYIMPHYLGHQLGLDVHDVGDH